MSLSDALLPWFALEIRARHERFVASTLYSKGFEVFLPLYISKRRWSDRIKKIELPLLPGYLFCRFDPKKRMPILVTPGVRQVVGTGKTPVPVDESEIAALQSIVVSRLQARPWPFLQVGQRVRIAEGPLYGVEGILLDSKKRDRLVVSVTLLQRSVAVEIDGDWAVPAGTALRGSLQFREAGK
jgi:transcription antitermination factor NusG